MDLRVGMGQMRVEGGLPEANLARAEGMIRQAAEAQCDVLVLPECLDLGWTHPCARTMAETVPGPRFERLSRAAKDAGIHVAAGLTELEGERIYNTAVLIGPTGALLLKHRKINILNIAQDVYSVGDRLGVAQTSLGMVGLLICADNFPESLDLGRSLARMGARLILSPCAWAVPPDYDNQTQPYGELWRGAYTTLTTEHNLAVIGVSNVGAITEGPWKGYPCIGCSLAMGPGGEALLQAPYGEDAEGLHVVCLPR